MNGCYNAVGIFICLLVCKKFLVLTFLFSAIIIFLDYNSDQSLVSAWNYDFIFVKRKI